MLRLNGVVKQYPYGKRLFGALDLDVEPGEVIALLGCEKSGKTSFIKTVCGIEKCEGTITLDGNPVTTKTDDVVVVFDDFAVFKNHSVAYNLAYPLKIRGVKNPELSRLVALAAQKVGLVSALDMRASRLSPIELRKMSLARVFLRDVKLVLVDDIFGGIQRYDADIFADEALRLLRAKAKDGAVVIFATRDSRLAFEYADRVIVLVDGIVKQIGTREDILSAPKTIWSREAVERDYNAIKGRLMTENGRLQFEFSLFGEQRKLDVDCLASAIVEDCISKDVYLGFSAKDVDIVEDGIELSADVVMGREDGYVLEKEENLQRIRVFVENKRQSVVFLPRVDKCVLYDQNENSIMKNQ